MGQRNGYGTSGPGDDCLKVEGATPCDCCGKLRTRGEGGTIFTVCDQCWPADHTHAVPDPAPTGGDRTAEQTMEVTEHGDHNSADAQMHRVLTSLYIVLPGDVAHDVEQKVYARYVELKCALAAAETRIAELQGIALGRCNAELEVCIAEQIATLTTLATAARAYMEHIRCCVIHAFPGLRPQANCEVRAALAHALEALAKLEPKP